MDTTYTKTPLKDKLAIIKDLAIIISMAYFAVVFLEKKGIIQYQNGMVSIPALIPYHQLFKLIILLIGAAFAIFVTWHIYNFLANKSTHESYITLFTLFAFNSLIGWAGTFYLLSTPLTIIQIIAVLLSITTFAVVITCITVRAIWLTILDSY